MSRFKENVNQSDAIRAFGTGSVVFYTTKGGQIAVLSRHYQSMGDGQREVPCTSGRKGITRFFCGFTYINSYPHRPKFCRWVAGDSMQAAFEAGRSVMVATCLADVLNHFGRSRR